MFDLLAIVIVGPREVLFETSNSVVTAYQGFGDKFDKEGVLQLSWHRKDFAIFRVHDDLAVVKTVLTREDANGAPIKTWNCSYTTRRVGNDWRLTLATSDGATNATAW